MPKSEKCLYIIICGIIILLRDTRKYWENCYMQIYNQMQRYLYIIMMAIILSLQDLAYAPWNKFPMFQQYPKCLVCFPKLLLQINHCFFAALIKRRIMSILPFLIPCTYYIDLSKPDSSVMSWLNLQIQFLNSRWLPDHMVCPNWHQH